MVSASFFVSGLRFQPFILKVEADGEQLPSHPIQSAIRHKHKGQSLNFDEWNILFLLFLRFNEEDEPLP